MKRKTIFTLSLDEIQKLPTAQLLGRLQRLHQCEESLIASDQTSDDENPIGSIVFKDSEEWAEAYLQLKMVLAQREHTVKGAELVALRREKAEKQKTVERKIRKRL